MKKTLLALFAFAALVSCTKDNVLENNKEAIGFNKTFIQNSVKSVSDPSFTADNMFTDFAVYGFVEGAVLFDGTQVSKSISNDKLTSVWKYEGTQYWIAGANYNFNAVAPKTNGGWTKTAATKDATKLFFTNNGTTDLLYASAAQQGKVSGNETVAFTFNHILSKVKFSFQNAYNASNATIKVKDVKINNAYTKADANLTYNADGELVATWNNHATDNLVLTFGMATDDESTTATNENAEVAYAFGKTYESQNERFLIPNAVPTQTVNEETVNGYKVTFTVDLLVSGTLVKSYNHTVYADFTPVAGQSYDIKAVINAENIDPDNAQEPIEFTVNKVEGWGTTNNIPEENN